MSSVHSLTLDELQVATKLEALIVANREKHDREHETETVQIRQVFEAGNALRAQGFDISEYRYSRTYMGLEITISDLPRVYKALGGLEVYNKTVAYENGEPSKDKVRVTVQSKRFPTVSFSYTKQLPPISSSTRKCRIVTESRVDTYARLVCEV